MDLDRDIDQSVAVVVGETGAAADDRLPEGGPGRRGDILEAAVHILIEEHLLRDHLGVSQHLERPLILDRGAVDDQQVVVAVEVKVEEAGAPADQRRIDRRQAMLEGGVGEEQQSVLRQITVEGVVLADPVGEEEVEPAVSVIVGDGGTHAGARVAGAGFDRDLLEGAVAPVAVEPVEALVIADIEIGPTVVVEVGKDGLETPPRAVRQPRALGDLGEPAAAVVLEKQILLGRVVGGRGHGGGPSSHLGPLGHPVPRKIDIAGNIEIEVAVEVEVGECRPVGDAVDPAQAGAGAGVLEAAITQVPEQDDLVEAGDQQVEPAVTVEVRPDGAIVPADVLEAGRGSDVFEGAVGQIAEELAAGTLGQLFPR